VVEAAPHYAKVAFDIASHHKNAAGGVMGGAIFTAADFAFAIASNYGNLQTVGTNCSIQYLAAAKGTQIIAEAHAEKIGRKLCFFTVRVYDELDTQIAIVSCTGYTHG
jgi:acyl-CoA thioesterase